MNAETHDTTPQRRPVLVGIDESESSMAAVRWAAEEAVARGLPLQLVHATPYDHPVVIRGVHGAESMLARARTVARHFADGVEVSSRLVTGPAATVLREASTEASLLVLGLTGGGRVSEVLLGSTTLAVSGRAGCPVVGVRTWPIPPSPRPEIVLGLDADTDPAVLDTALRMAEHRGCSVVVVHCAHGADADASGTTPGWLQDQLTTAHDHHPEIKVHTEVHTGLGMNTTNTLLQRAARADAVVVGTRNRGPAARIVLGSTSRGLLRHSQAPVVVVGPGVRADAEADDGVRRPERARDRAAHR